LITASNPEFPFIEFPSPMSDPYRPSPVRVFGKSLHLLAAGWIASVGWLWFAGMRQQLLRQGAVPDDLGFSMILAGAISALALEGIAIAMVRWTGRAPLRVLEREEWQQAFWWSLAPNVLLLVTAYLMILAAA
jgi:hypothetical protein